MLDWLYSALCWVTQGARQVQERLDLYLALSSCEKHVPDHHFQIHKPWPHRFRAQRCSWYLTPELDHNNIDKSNGGQRFSCANRFDLAYRNPFQWASKAAAESLKIYRHRHRGQNLHYMCALKTLMLPSLYLDSFAVGALLIFTHKCLGVIKSQMKYFLCHQYLSACHFQSLGRILLGPESLFKPGI